MCQKCQEIDAKIASYKKALVGVNDRTAIALLNLVISDLKSDKVGLHPEDK